MALASLRFDARADVDENRSGFSIYDGTPSRYYEWEFRTLAKQSSCKKDDRSQLASKIVEGLQGNALAVAMKMLIPALEVDDGTPRPTNNPPVK